MKIILFIIILGGGFTMWDVLFSASLKSYKNPFGRRILFMLINALLFPTFYFFIGYAFSFFAEGNFIVASMLHGFLKPLGIKFVASPLINIILESLLPIFLIIYLYLLQNQRFKTSQKGFEVQGDKVVIEIDSSKIEVDKHQQFQIFRFNCFLMIFTLLLLFRIVAYPKFQTLAFSAILVVLGLFLLLYGLLAMIALKNISTEVLIQNLFNSTGYDEVLTLFEYALKGEPVILSSEQLTPKVEEFIMMGIFEASQSTKKDLFPNAQTARIIISSENISLYQKYKARVSKSKNKLQNIQKS